MTARVIEHQSTLSVIAIATAVIVLYSIWGASLLATQRQAANFAPNPQTQLARN